MPDAGDPIDVADFASALDDHETRIGTMEPQLSAVVAQADAIDNALIGYIKGTDPFTQVILKGDSSVVLLDSGGQGTVTFSTPFPNSILSVVVCNGDTGTAKFAVGVDSKSASSFTFQCSTIDSTPGADPVDWVPVNGATVRIEWLAFGT